MSVDSAGVEGDLESSWIDTPAISADGRVVAFASEATNLVANDTNGTQDVFVHDRLTGITERINVDSNGVEAYYYPSGTPVISADGQIVAFYSYASNLVSGDGNSTSDIFVHDRATGVTERVSVDSNGGEGDGLCGRPAISADGLVVAFCSGATNLVAGDTNSCFDVFVHDRLTDVTERVSVDSSGAEAHGDSGSHSQLALSADGQIVAFDSLAYDLVAGDANGVADVFVHDRTTGLTERVSVKGARTEANDTSLGPSLSADGQIVAFWSKATNLMYNDKNRASDVFVHDRATGTTKVVSVRWSGTQGNDASLYPSLSADGQLVTFSSAASNLVLNDTNGATDAFLHDRQTGRTERLSVDSTGAEGDQDSSLESSPAISADGLVVAFSSNATNLVANDTNGKTDVFVHEFCSTPASWSNYGAGFPGSAGVPTFTSRQNPVLGTTITLDLSNSQASPTAGLMFVGFQRTSIYSGWGGDLLVVPVLTIPVAIPANGATFTGTLPHDDLLCGTTVDLQALEADAGAAKGVSFTQGLELVLGK